jgi:hypothetical protein
MPTFTLIGYATSPGGRPRVGTVTVLPNTEIRHLDGSALLVGPDRVTTDALGAWSIELPCDGPDVNPSQGIGYRLEYALSGASRSPQEFYATADLAGTVLNVSDLVTTELDWPTPLTTTKGDKGDTGPANTLSIGATVTLAPGSPATAAITGDAPDQELSLGIPEGLKGDKGDQGDKGDTGPANTLSIGAVTTKAAGSLATAAITGAAPNQVLDLGLTKGDPGGWVTSSNVAAGVSLDTLTTPGLYVVAAAGQSDTLLSLPAVSWRGHLEVLAFGGSVIMQRATSIYSDDANGSGGLTDRGNVYFRSRNGASWGPWLKLYTRGEVGGGDIIGQGSPEGVRTAPVGSYYTDTNQAQGAVRWFKATGTGNTGWKCIQGDTGWCPLAAWNASQVMTNGALNAAWTPRAVAQAGGIWVRRVGSTVQCYMTNLAVATANSSAAPVVVPAGFVSSQPAASDSVARYTSANAANLFYMSHALSRGSNLTTAVGDYIVGGLLVWLTDQAWPTVLPA